MKKTAAIAAIVTAGLLGGAGAASAQAAGAVP